MKDKNKQLLEAGVVAGAWVRLVNIADVEMKADRVCVRVHGKLTAEADDQTYSVCSQDVQGNGTNSISFRAEHIDHVFRQPSGIIEITLR